MATNNSREAIQLVNGPPLMDLLEAMFFKQDKQLGFYPHDRDKPILITLSGMFHQNGIFPLGLGNSPHLLLFGHYIGTLDRDCPLRGKQVSVNYNPRLREGSLHEEPDIKMRNETVYW